MTAIQRVTRARALADDDMLYVNAIAGFALAVACVLLAHYGSFARLLVAAGLSPTG